MTADNRVKRSFALTILGFVVPCILVAVPAVIAYRAERELSASFGWVTHTREVQRHLQKILFVLVDAEARQRGFLLTMNEAFLEAYQSAPGVLAGEMTALRGLTGDNAVQRENIALLGPLVKGKFAFMEQTISLLRQGEKEAVISLVSTHRGKVIMDSIRTLIERMDAEEGGLLSIRQQHLALNARRSTTILVALVIINVIFAGTVIYLLRRLERLQNLVTVCAWSRTVEYQGEWLSFEEYLRRRFNLNTSHGISPEEVKKAFGELNLRKGDKLSNQQDQESARLPDSAKLITGKKP